LTPITEEEIKFAKEQANNVLKKITNKVGLNPESLSAYQHEMYQSLAEYNEYAWSRGSSGLSTGFPVLDSKTGGLQPGLYLVAAQPNVGKSAFCIQMARQIAHNNENIYVIFISLDDSFKMMLPRFIACDQRIPIDAAKFPVKYNTPETQQLVERYNDGLAKMIEDIPRFKLIDGESCESVEQIEDIILEHYEGFGLENNLNKKLVVFIDNFHDLQSSEHTFGNDNQKYEYMAGKVKDLVNIYDIPLICTAELKKVKGLRPTVEDIRETVKVGYEANLVWLLYNDVGLKDQAAKVYYQSDSESSEKRPVLECHFGKNKISSYKGRIYFLFHPEHSYLREVPELDQAYFDSKVYG